MAKMKPAFKKDGTVTAANSSKISDGASALVLMSSEKATALGLKPMAKSLAQAEAGVELEDVLVAPIYSIPKALKKADLSLKEIDLFEVNEAFAASTTLPSSKPWGLSPIGSISMAGSGLGPSHRRQWRPRSHHPPLRHERHRTPREEWPPSASEEAKPSVLSWKE